MQDEFLTLRLDDMGVKRVNVDMKELAKSSHGFKKKTFCGCILGSQAAYGFNENIIKDTVATIKNGGILFIINEKKESHMWTKLSNCLGIPHGHIGSTAIAYHVDVLRRRWNDKSSLKSTRNR
jgi:hypothetical protein